MRMNNSSPIHQVLPVVGVRIKVRLLVRAPPKRVLSIAQRSVRPRLPASQCPLMAPSGVPPPALAKTNLIALAISFPPVRSKATSPIAIVVVSKTTRVVASIVVGAAAVTVLVPICGGAVISVQRAGRLEPARPSTCNNKLQ